VQLRKRAQPELEEEEVVHELFHVLPLAPGLAVVRNVCSDLVAVDLDGSKAISEFCAAILSQQIWTESEAISDFCAAILSQ
jgi:hypothetical protein